MNVNEKRDHLDTMLQAKKEIENLQIALHIAEVLNEKQEKELDQLRSEYRRFIDLTWKMREYQKLYFQTRDQSVLETSKQTEKQVDKALQAFREREATLELPFG